MTYDHEKIYNSYILHNCIDYIENQAGFEDIYYNINKNNKDEIIRAAMESIGFLVNDILDILDDNNSTISSFITASGGF